MNAEQEKLAEKIIEILKLNNSKMDKSKILKQLPKIDEDNFSVIRSGLLEKDLISEVGKGFFWQLTIKGSEFKGFENERLLSIKQNEKLELDIIQSKWLVKTRWWPFIISIIALLVAIFSAYYTYKSYN